MRLATLQDKDLIESICNNPLLRVWTACDGAPLCDATKYLTAPSFTVVDDRGCFLAFNIAPGAYVIHTNLLPHCRGAEALKAFDDALKVAFIQTDATELLTMVPKMMPHARYMARKAGFVHQFDRWGIWPAGGIRHDMGFYRLQLSDWIATGVLKESGEAYHQRLHHELGAKDHPDDPVHDAYVGAAIEMVKAKNLSKAVQTYNKWAAFALYKQIKVVSYDPLLIDIGQGVLKVEGDSFFMEADHA